MYSITEAIYYIKTNCDCKGSQRFNETQNTQNVTHALIERETK